MSFGYTEKEVNDLIAFAGFSINTNTLEQMRKTTKCVKVTNETKYPASAPFCKIISRQTCETKNRQIKMMPEAYQQEHLLRVGAAENYTVLDGTHFIYLNNAEEIGRLTEKFLRQHRTEKYVQ